MARQRSVRKAFLFGFDSMDFLCTGVDVTVESRRARNTSFFYNASAGNNTLQSQNFSCSFATKF